MMMPKPIRSISTVKKMTAKRELAAGMKATIYTAPRGVAYDHVASSRLQVGAARARPVLGEGRPPRRGGVLPRRRVPGDRKHLQPQGRPALRGQTARRVRDV